MAVLIKIITLAGGLTGAAVLSQYPEFTQQYTQRLAGQVDALTEVVADFDRSALAAGLTRTEALDQLQGTSFLDARRSDMQRAFTRQAALSENLAQLRAATPLQRLVMPHRLADTETFQQTLGDYTPAVPVTSAGLAAAGAGFVAGWALLSALFAALFGVLRRRPQLGQSQPVRTEPPLARAPNAPTHSRPTLKGETRP